MPLPGFHRLFLAPGRGARICAGQAGRSESTGTPGWGGGGREVRGAGCDGVPLSRAGAAGIRWNGRGLSRRGSTARPEGGAEALAAASHWRQRRQDTIHPRGRAASLLDHPHICPVYDIGELPSGDLLLAMAYCEGETLKAHLSRGRCPSPRRWTWPARWRKPSPRRTRGASFTATSSPRMRS
jgi:hypothetical protein